MRTWTVILFLLSTFAFPLAFGTCYAVSSPAVYDPKCEYKTNPMGIDVERPRLSWKIAASRRAAAQSAYQIRTAQRVDDLAQYNRRLWDSGKVQSDKSVHVVCRGPALLSRQRIWWQVRIWDEQDRPSDWSDPAFWEMG
ncbi:MAG: glycoside hydrolase family 78 protein, partial [Planctomycetota bacterium]